MATGKLAKYRAKRDFKQTAEPRGGKVRAAEYPRFVIQKHDATRLHYDLRLEVDGVFKSWAVTRGPSLDPKEKRLAVEVEDHPLDYGDFEGTIPKDAYGGGTVMLWDRGFWVAEHEQSALAALSDGELKLTVAGEKLKGSYVLVRMKHDREASSGRKRQTNWLLIKHRDEYAKPGDGEGILKKDRSVASGRTMRQIARGEGDAPEAFMTRPKTTPKPDAIWHDTKPKGGGKPASSSKRRSRAPNSVPKIQPIKNSSENVVCGVSISNAEKVLWPEHEGQEAVNKRDLALYFEAVGPWMLQHIAGRPCSIVRAPDGIEENSFFQRHAMRGTSDHVTTVKVPGDREPYLQIDTLEALIAMAQSAAVELHPWNGAIDEPTIPGRLIFDLDPAPDVAFDEVVAAAREMKDRLEKIGLIPFCKTTGGKGLHVVTPLKTDRKSSLGWDEAKTFAQALCASMAEDNPDKYLITMSKTKRKGRIFLDYLRNDRIATAVAPLSPRARPGAPVSMPLTWGQVRAGLDPMRFTVKSVPKLMAASKAWQDYPKSACSLKAAIQSLIKSQQ